MSSPGAKLRVFVVEDHPGTSRALKMFLEASGFAVDVALDCRSALKLARTAKFDVLLCDLNLPDGTGWSLLRKIKRIVPGVRALAFSAFDDVDHVARSRAAGFLQHVVKGGPADELIAHIRKAHEASAPQSTSRPKPSARKSASPAGAKKPASGKRRA